MHRLSIPYLQSISNTHNISYSFLTLHISKAKLEAGTLPTKDSSPNFIKTAWDLATQEYTTASNTPKGKDPIWFGVKLRNGLPWWLSGRESTCQCRRHEFHPWVRKIAWRRKWQPTPVFLPGESHGQRSLAGYSPWGRKESDTTEQLNNNTSNKGKECSLWASHSTQAGAYATDPLSHGQRITGATPHQKGISKAFYKHFP